MYLTRHPAFEAYENEGIFFPGAMDWLRKDEDGNPSYTAPYVDLDDLMGASGLAMDAIVGTQQSLITAPNAGIPAMFTTYIDPKVIEVLLAPNKAAEIMGEVRKGSWLDETAGFPMVEVTGNTSSYGDFSEDGRAGANAQFEWRQSYLYQAFIEWGEREAERMALARIDWVSRLRIANATTLGKFQNNSYFFGVANLQNYGLLNDPSLSAAVTPTTKQGGGTSWSIALPEEILKDVQKMFAQLQTQTNGLVSIDDELTLALHPTTEVYLVNTNSFGMVAMGMLKTAFPKLRIVSAVQYLSGSIYSAQLIAKAVDGQEVGYCSFNEKMRAHRMIYRSSSALQKTTQGTWGTIITFPAGISSISGI